MTEEEQVPRFRAFLLRPQSVVEMIVIDETAPGGYQAVANAVPQATVIQAGEGSVPDVYMIDRECYGAAEQFQFSDSYGCLRVRDPRGRAVRTYSPSGWLTMTSMHVETPGE